MTDVLILAAGLGTRMKSKRAKVLHELGGSPLIAYTVRAAWELSPHTILTVTGHQAEQVESAVREEAQRCASRGSSTKPSPQLLLALQAEQRGTGHAVMSAAAQLKGLSGPVLVLAGDVPLIKSTTLEKLHATHSAEKNVATIMTVELDDPFGYGRIIRRDGRFVRSVEQKDATPEEQAIREINVSIYCFEIPALLDALQALTTDNAQGEYYLTDVPATILAAGQRVGLLKHDDPEELRGVNTRVELADLERELRHQKLRSLMLSGVTIVDPSTTYIHSGVEIGEDTIIHPQVMIEGASSIGAGCEIQSWSRLRNVVIEDGVIIKNSCVLEDSTIRRGASVGPFARLRANADIGEKAGIGNFVEVKKSKLGRGTKASHLTYLGDATLGDRVNIGAGTVTCNYDGVRKNETIIEDEVRIGSDTMLVAPVRVGRGAMTAAGSVVTKDVPPDSLVAGVPAAVKKRLK
jgi:bifunctional UDP-N-acetylglucosamine pyrophosphorylase/glucosamine-1-phosphate N-acetyltransferase